MAEQSAQPLFDTLARCRPWIEAALSYAHDTHTFDDVAGMVLGGRAFLWATDKSCAVLEIMTYPQSKGLRIFLAGGDLGDIQANIPDVEAFAQSLGCNHLEFEGRRGWLRSLPGWKATAVTMRKDV